jgi:hypothetical protein
MAISSEERKEEKEREEKTISRYKEKILEFLGANREKNNNTKEEIFNHTVRNTLPHTKNPKKEEGYFGKAINELLKEKKIKSKPNKEKYKDDVFYII